MLLQSMMMVPGWIAAEDALLPGEHALDVR